MASGSKPKINRGRDRFAATDKKGNLVPQPFDGNVKDGEGASKLVGFPTETEKDIYPLVDKQSMLLFQGIQELEHGNIKAITHAIVSCAESPISINKKLLPVKTGSQFKINLLKLHTVETRTPKFKKPLELGWKRLVKKKRKVGAVSYVSPTGSTYKSLNGIAKYLKENPEVKLSAEDFSFVAIPVGAKDATKEAAITSKSKSKIEEGKDNKLPPKTAKRPTASNKPIVVKSNPVRRNIQPPKRYATGDTSGQPEKKTKIAPKVELEKSDNRAMTMGMLPPKYPKDTETNQTEVSIVAQESSVLKRRGRPPKVRVIEPQHQHQMMTDNNDEGDGLFQISALQYSNSLLTTLESMGPPQHDYVPHRQVQKRRNSQLVFQSPSPLSYGGAQPMYGLQYQSKDEELLPCSIRCVGMTGEVPTLQCKRCLCLYHPECIGLPGNNNFNQFLCSNCEKKGAGHHHLNESPQSQITLRPPPKLIPTVRVDAARKWNSSMIQASSSSGFVNRRMDNSGFQSIGQGGMSVKRLDTLQGQIGRQIGGPGVKMMRPGTNDVGMSISAVSIKRKPGRPAGNQGGSKMVIPQISRSLSSIPPISIRGPRPQVPDLRVPGNRSSVYQGTGLKFNPRLAVQKKKLLSKLSTVSMSISAGGGMVPHLARKIGPPPKLSINRIHPPPGRQIMQRNKPRYPQSVVSIGSKKFIVVNSEAAGPVEVKEFIYVPGAKITEVPLWEDVLNSLFSYLSVKDLLSASRVSRMWNRVATRQSLWQTVRMKNTHVFDVRRFSLFLNKHGTEVVDLRKMSTAGVDLQLLFHSLTGVKSLRKIMFGSPFSTNTPLVDAFRKMRPLVELDIS